MIVDASVALKWLVLEDDTAQALDLLAATTLAAPIFLQIEVGNALWKKHRRGEFGADFDPTSFIERIGSFVEMIDETPMIPRAAQIAVALGHPIYDCVYLAMAETLQRPLITADKRFLAALAGTDLAPLVHPLVQNPV